MRMILERGRAISAIEHSKALLARSVVLQRRRASSSSTLRPAAHAADAGGAWSVEPGPDEGVQEIGGQSAATDVRPAPLHLPVQPDRPAGRDRPVRVHGRGPAGRRSRSLAAGTPTRRSSGPRPASKHRSPGRSAGRRWIDLHATWERRRSQGVRASARIIQLAAPKIVRLPTRPPLLPGRSQARLGHEGVDLARGEAASGKGRRRVRVGGRDVRDEHPRRAVPALPLGCTVYVPAAAGISSDE